MEVKVSYSGPIFRGVENLFKGAMVSSAQRIALVVEDAAKEDYIKKRKTQELPSMIFDSFYYDVPVTQATRVTAVVFAGGPKAPYAPYVDEGHTLRNGRPWSGYHFMRVGRDVGATKAPEIVKEEFGKL